MVMTSDLWSTLHACFRSACAYLPRGPIMQCMHPLSHLTLDEHMPISVFGRQSCTSFKRLPVRRGVCEVC